MKNIIEEINNLSDLVRNLRNPFEEFIANKSIALDTRWDLFVNATTDLKRNNVYAFELEKVLPDDFIGYDMPIHVDRYQTMTTTDLVEKVEELKDEVSDYEYLLRYKDVISSLDVNVLKEEILLHNIGSITNDW